jgi:hypothetical protein
MNGMALILASWGLKHLLVSIAIFGGGQGMETSAIRAEIDAQVWEETFEDQLELAEIEADLADDKGSDKKYEKMQKLQEDIDDARKDIEEDHLEAIVDARYGSVKGESRSLSMMKWTLKIKILLDLLKIAGVFMIVFSSLRILSSEPDPADTTEHSTRLLAITTIALVLLGTFVQGIVSYFS